MDMWLNIAMWLFRTVVIFMFGAIIITLLSRIGMIGVLKLENMKLKEEIKELKRKKENKNDKKK